jgi:hypothetical protein
MWLQHFQPMGYCQALVELSKPYRFRSNRTPGCQNVDFGEFVFLSSTASSIFLARFFVAPKALLSPQAHFQLSVRAERLMSSTDLDEFELPISAAIAPEGLS